jgi:hypothetical protein
MPTDDYPPRVPELLFQLDRAICLLGERKKNALSARTCSELVDLLGACPSPPTAAAWKMKLKELRRDLALERLTP